MDMIFLDQDAMIVWANGQCNLKCVIGFRISLHGSEYETKVVPSLKIRGVKGYCPLTCVQRFI